MAHVEYDGSTYPIVVFPGYRIPVTWGLGLTVNDALKMAHKLSAVDELLEACNDAVQVWEGQEDPFEFPRIGTILRAAIAKAERP
jgi:hypothetical protein